MPVTTPPRERDQLKNGERYAALAAAAILFVIAVWIVIDPPDRTVALGGCDSASSGCLVSVDGDVTTFAAAIAAFAAAAGLIALLGIRFTSIEAAGVKVSRAIDPKFAGLPEAEQQPPPGAGDEATGEGEGLNQARAESAESPVKVGVVAGLGKLGVVPVAVASLDAPMNEDQARFLRDYQGARRASQHAWFLTHVLGPAKSAGQKYSVAIKVTPHERRATGEVVAARFYLGRAWGHQVFQGSRGADGQFGITTEAYGPFLALCEVEFADGERILLDHYCDFEMGALVAT